MGWGWVLPLGMCLVVTGMAGAQSPRVKASVAVTAGERSGPSFRAFSEPVVFRVELSLPGMEPPARRERERVPGAVVEVWGDSTWARQDEFRAFVRGALPSLHGAFDVGAASSIGAHSLRELMDSPEDLHKAPGLAPRVWANQFDPWARNPRFYR